MQKLLDDFLLCILPLCWKGRWLTVDEMAEVSKLCPANVRWCLRQLRTGPEGDFILRRRKREPAVLGKTEIYIKRKPAQLPFPFEPKPAA